jgi:hypothetical protein
MEEFSVSLSTTEMLGLPAVLLYALKIIWQFGTLIARLGQLPKPDVICVQVSLVFLR